jgi:phosphohistidine phosphatase SixA
MRKPNLAHQSVALTLALFGCTAAPASKQTTPEKVEDALPQNPAVIVYVARHAEKAISAENESDPPLSEAGKLRAAALAKTVDLASLVAVYATPFARTQDTAKPTATAAGLTVTPYLPSSAKALADELKRLTRGHVLVIGHSNTVPEILAALGVVEAVTLTDSDFGDLFVVTLGAKSGVTMERRRFGESLPVLTSRARMGARL